ncbi:MAG: GNAT family N-acetyltransferase [Rhodocyclaceae bacterium]|nr:GNAT family N-acetyltransferase [Rhodocyclaceae bacterium]MBX3669006.1 GNAT family N-acetyltransferase [Rhodocyclaceae bacterium]
MSGGAWAGCAVTNGLGEHAASWDQCNRHYFNGHPLFDSRFINLLLKYFGSGRERLFFKEGEQGQKEMCLLVTGKRSGWTSFYPSQLPASPVFVQNIQSVDGIVAAAPAWTVQFDFLGQDPLFSRITDGLAPAQQAIPHATTISISLSGKFDDYWESRPRKLIQNIRRYGNRIAQANHQVRYVCIEAAEQMADAVARYGRLEQAGWKFEQGTAVLPDNDQGRFYAELLATFAATGNAKVYEMWLDDRLAASRLVVHDEHLFIMLKTSYDQELSQFAPGRLLLHDVIKDAFRRVPGGSIEFYTNATLDQHEWATHNRTIMHQTRYRSDAVLVLRELAKCASRHLKKVDDADGRERTVEAQAIADTELQAPVRKLFDQAERRAFDLGWPWFENLASTYKFEQEQPKLFVSSTEGRPLVALPMVLSDDTAAREAKGFGTYYTTLFEPIFGPSTSVRDVRAVIEQIMAERPSLAEMRFAPLDPASYATAALRTALQASGWVTFGYFGFGNWYLPVTGNYQAYFDSRDAKVRHTIQRRGRKFLAEGGWLEVISGGDRLEAGLEAYKSVYAASWKLAEPHPEFIPGLVRMLAQTGRLRLGIAWLRDKPVAAQIWVFNHGKAGIYKVGFDEAYAAFSPGTLLTAHLMELAIDREKVHEVDYYIGDDPYKTTWMTHRRERWGIVAYNPRHLTGAWRAGREIAGRVIKSALKVIPRSESRSGES